MNFLSRDITGALLPLLFDTTTFDIEASDLRTFGTRHILSYGGNYRHNSFDISIAPNGDDRNEGGAYVQDEIFLTDRFRWVVGGRLDKFSSIDNAVFSPRTTLMYKPSLNQTVRLWFNRAFRAPSFINNNLDVTLLNQVNLSAISPALSAFVFPFRAVGNADLEQETMTAYEIGYTGVLNRRATVTAAVYWNTTDDAIFFTQNGPIHGRQSASDVATADSNLCPEPDSAAGPAVTVFVSATLGPSTIKGSSSAWTASSIDISTST